MSYIKSKEEIEALAEKWFEEQDTLIINPLSVFIAGYNAANEWVSVDIEPNVANAIVAYPYSVCAAKYISGKYFLTHDWAQEIPEVTHWMPLPTPPTI